MKNLIKFFAVLLLFVGYTSCDELDKLTEVDFNTSITERIIVNVDGGENVVFYNDVLVNIDNPDTHDYLSKIESVRINSLTYKAVNVDGDANGVIHTADLRADGEMLATHTELSGNALYEIYSIDDTAKLTIIANDLKSGADVQMAISGSISSQVDLGMQFDLEITLDLTITADAL